MVTVILSGGRGSRAKGSKACRFVAHSAWIAHQCRELRKQRCTQIRVVVGFSAGRVARCVPLGVRKLCNTRPAFGPFSSLQKGLTCVKEAVLVVPIDAALPTAATLFRMRRALRLGAAVIPAWRGRGGHPILLGAALAVSLAHVPPSPSHRLDRFLRSASCRRVPTQDRSVLVNLNKSSDWALYLRHQNLRRPLWMA